MLTTRRPAAASALVYVFVTAFLGRGVLARLGTHVVHDTGDPLLTAAILHWNARHLPLTDSWWQFPTFFPTRDTLAFSEHLLGLSVIAAPVDWLTGDPLVTYNLMVLLTFPLCAVAAYALVFRLTRSAAGAFIAGLAFAFAPYRMSQLPHIQMLATFWAPLALLGLHGYVDSRRLPWLVLYGAAWTLQAAANGYALIYFSLLVGLWVLWFVAARRDWRALGAIGGTTLVAALLLAPIVYKYATVHAFQGFERSVDEMALYSADFAAVLCASPDLTFWGWLRVGCRAEGELFPGAALAALCIALLVMRLRSHQRPTFTLPAALELLRWAVSALAVVYGLGLISVLTFGPWQIDLGPAHLSASSARKPLLGALASTFVLLITSPKVIAAARRSSISGFYLSAAVATWLLSLGPFITLTSEPIGFDGPFAWLIALPGMTALRVPARFWLITSLCLAVVAGIAVARMLEGKRREARAAAVAILAAVLLTDGWVGEFRTEQTPATVQAVITNGVALSLPIGTPLGDIAAQWRAVLGGWKTLNGYSGWVPVYYHPLARALADRNDEMVDALRRLTPLYVDVSADNADGWRGWITTLDERPSLVAVSGGRAVYLFEKLGTPAVRGSVPFTVRSSSCDFTRARLVTDAAYDTAWQCDGVGQGMVLELQRPVAVSGMSHAVGPFPNAAPRGLRVELSLDGATWREVWSGPTLAETVRAAMEDPRRVELRIAFAPSRARFVRLTQIDDEPDVLWSIAELRILEPS